MTNDDDDGLVDPDGYSPDKPVMWRPSGRQSRLLQEWEQETPTGARLSKRLARNSRRKQRDSDD